MSEYTNVERPFLEKLSQLGWTIINHNDESTYCPEIMGLGIKEISILEMNYLEAELRGIKKKTKNYLEPQQAAGNYTSLVIKNQMGFLLLLIHYAT